MIKILPLSLFFIIILACAGAAQDDNGSYLQITIEYKSMSPGDILVRDEECKSPRSIECEEAGIKTRSKPCQKDIDAKGCREALALLGSNFCIEGLVFDGRMSRGEKISLAVCKSSMGLGNVSIRVARKGATWTNYSMIQDGDTLRFP